MGGEAEFPEENGHGPPDHQGEPRGFEGLSADSQVGDREILNAKSGAPDPIEIALADAITAAVAAGRFEVLPSLAAELAARRRAP